jgi:NAD(P)-dependent dehydrogenase (short-subunit alcohol dehydrogenase family)
MAANDIKQKLADTKLDVLINNAGIIAGLSMEKTEDGIETTFGVNHLGHFLLTGLLMRSMAQDARIVCVTSTAFMGSDIRWNDINFKVR